MEENNVEEKTEPATKVTTDTKETKPKHPGRVAQGKKLAEENKKGREAKNLLEKSNKADEKKNDNDLQSIPGGDFHLTLNQMIGIAGVCVSAYGL